MNPYISISIAAVIAACFIAAFKLRQLQRLKALIKDGEYEKLSTLSWTVFVHIALITGSFIIAYFAYATDSLSLYISSLLIVLLCLFELMFFSFDGTVYYSNNNCICQNTKIKNKNIVRIETRGKIFVSGKIITTNGKEFLIGGKVAKTLKNKLKK